MSRYDLTFDAKKGPPEPGTYFCTNCNKKQVIYVKGENLQPCPKCGHTNFTTFSH